MTAYLMLSFLRCHLISPCSSQSLTDSISLASDFSSLKPLRQSDQVFWSSSLSALRRSEVPVFSRAFLDQSDGAIPFDEFLLM